MAIATQPTTDIRDAVRSRMAQRGITGAQADAVMAKLEARLNQRNQQQANTIPEDGSGFVAASPYAQPQGPISAALSGAIRGFSPGAGFLADEASRALIRGSIGIPESAAGAVQGVSGLMEGAGRMADVAPAVAIDAARRAIQNPGQAARAAFLGQPMPIDETSIALMQAGINRAEQDPNQFTQAGGVIRQAADPAIDYYGGQKADPAIAPSDMARAHPFSPSGITSASVENLPQLAIQLAAAYASGGGGTTGRIAGFAGSAFPMELGGAQVAGREGFMQQGASADEAAQRAAPGAFLQASVNAIIETLSGAGIFSQAQKAAAKMGLYRQVLGVIKQGGKAGLTGGTTEFAQEGVNVLGEVTSGSNPRAMEGAGTRLMQAGLVGGLMEGATGATTRGAEPGQSPPTDRMGGRGPTQERTPESDNTARSSSPAASNGADAVSGTQAQQGSSPYAQSRQDTTALDEAAAQAEARLNEQFNRAAPVGGTSADQSASSQTEQDAGANEMYDQAIDAIMQQRAERRAARQDTSVYDEALANILAQRNARRAERAATPGTTPPPTPGTTPGLNPDEPPGLPMRRVDRPASPRITLDPNAQVPEQQQPRRFTDRLTVPQRAPNAATPSTPTSARPASGSMEEGRTATGTEPGAGTSPSPALPGVQPPASSGQAPKTGGGAGVGTSASPQSTPRQVPQPAPAKVEGKGPASVAFRSPPPWKVRKELHDAGFERDSTGAWVGPDTDEARAVAKKISDERDAYLAAEQRRQQTPYRVDRPARPTVRLNPGSTPGTSPDATPGVRVPDRLGVLQRVTEAQQQDQTGAAQEQPVAPAGRTSPPMTDAPSASATSLAEDPKSGAQSREGSPSPQSTREPWQMTRGEYVNQRGEAYAKKMGKGTPLNIATQNAGAFEIHHERVVREAHAANKPVPPEVLAEYGLKPNPSESPKSSNPPAKPDSSTQPTQGTTAKDTPRYGIYPRQVVGRGTMFAVRESDNPNGYGDTIHATQAEAEKYAKEIEDRDRRNAESRERDRIAQEAKDREEAKRKAERENTRGFADSMPPMQRGKAIASLNTLIRVDGNADTIKAHVEKMVDAGGVEFATREEPKIKPMSRTEYNRASQREQEAHEKRMKEAGTKTVHLVNGYNLGKTAFDYAKFLTTQPQGQAAATTNKEPAPAKVEEKKPRAKPKPGDSAKSERQAEIDAIAPDSELDATGTTTTIADISNNVREGKRRYVTARDSQNKRLGASMLESVRKSVVSGMERLREERAKWETRGRATIPQEQTDGTGGSSAGSVGAARVNGQGAREGQQAEDAGRARESQPAKAGKTRAFSRADIERRIGKILSDLQLDRTAELEDYASEERDNNSLGSTFSTSFGGDIPADIKAWIDANKFFAKYFKTNQKNATGEDALGRLGLDKYIERVLEQFQPSKIARERSKMLRGYNPEANMLLWLLDRLEGGTSGRAKWKTVQASTLKDGQTFAIDGVNFEVMPNENEQLTVTQRGPNGEPIDNAQVWELAALTDIPVDENTMGQADDTGEVPDIAPEVKPAPAKFSDSEGVFGQKTESITGSQTGLFGSAKPVPVEAPKPKPAMWQVGDKFTVNGGFTNTSGRWVVVSTEDIDANKGWQILHVQKDGGTRRNSFSSEVLREDFKIDPPAAQYRRETALKKMTPEEAQDRYPGIRRGESVAEYEKRVGITDTPDMFSGTEDKGDINKAKRSKPKHAIQFKTPIVGPSGAKILSYEWAWTWESVDTKDDTVERRVSDWEKAELNDDTNRLIVHQFSVQQPNGDVRLVSLESALQMLGYMEKSSGKPIRSLASTLKTLAFNRMKLEQIRKVYDVFDAADNQARALTFNPKEVTTEVKDAPFSHLAKKGVKQVVWKYRGDEIHWEYWYPSSGRPIESSIKNPSQTVEDMGRSWKRDKIRDFLPDGAEGITEHDRKNASWRLGTLAAQIKDIEQRNEKLQRKIDTFDGGSGTGGASPGTAFRNAPTINDRAAAALMDWSNRARKRFDDYIGKMQRGELLGSGVPITPMIDLAAHVAFKALASGITSKSGRKLTAFIEGRMSEIRAKWPALNVTTDTLRRQVRSMLIAAGDDRDKIIPAYAEARERAERGRTRKMGESTGKPAEVREAVANATAERPDVAAKIIDAVKRGLRQGRAEGLRTASDAIKPLIRQARDAAKRARQVADIEARGASEKATNAAKDQAATEKGIRAEAVRLVQETPIAGRGKYLRAVAGAADMRDLSRILHRLRGDLAKETGRHYAARAEKLAKNLRTLNTDRREDARKLLSDIRQMWDKLRDKDTGTALREELAAKISESFERANTIFHEQKNADKVNILGRAIQASEHREKMVENLEKRPELPAPSNPNNKREKGWFGIRSMLDKFLTFQSLMQALDQEFYGNGIFARMGRAMSERQTAELGKVQDFTDRSDKLARKYGYKGLGEFLAKSSGALGEASQKWVNVQLGEFKRITLGNAMDIFARDPETRQKMHKGQTFTFDAEGGTNEFTIDDNKIAEIENALTPQEKGMAMEMNNLRSEMQYERMSDVYKMLTGNYLVRVPWHYPIRRAMKLSESPDITKGLGEWTIKRMEEAGYLKQRVGGNAPIVIGDFGMTQLRQVQMGEAFIQRASIVKYLGATVLHPDVRKAIVRRHGTKIMDRIQQTISEFSGNESPQQDKAMRRLLSNVARAQTQVNVGTWARNLATAFNIPLAVVDGKMLGVRKTLRGILGALRSPSKTMRILMKHSPNLRHRWSHAGASISLMHGNDVQASTDIADTAFSDASKATIRQIFTALKAIKAGDFKNQTAEIARPWRQLLDAIKLGNVFDGFGAMVAYHAVRADAPASLSDGAADKWAARRAADIFSQTANTNDLLNSNQWQMDARRSTWTAGILAFTSDIAKKQNLLYLATKRGKKATAYATAAVTLGALWSVAVTAALSGALGDDEDKVVKRAGEGLGKEFLTLLPGGTIASSGFEMWVNPRGTAGILDTPITAVAKNVQVAINKFTDAANDGDGGDLMEGAYRVLRIFSDVTGAPFGPTAGMVKRAIVNYGTE